MTKFILIRHGESEANRQGIFAGQYDVPLQDRGEEQARLTAGFIKDNYTPYKVYASDLQRAYNTGKAVADLMGIEIEKNQNLREINCAKWDRVKFSDMHLIDEEMYDKWMNDIGHCVTPGGESVAQLGERVLGAIEKIAEENPDKTIVIATHATPIRVLQSLIQTGGLDEMKNIPWVSNASVTELIFDGDKRYFGKISMDSHLGVIATSLPKDV